MNTLKSIGAILAGILANVILAVGTDAILMQTGIAPTFDENQPWPTKLLAVATIYRTLYGIAGGYITAMAAPQNSMKHVMILDLAFWEQSQQLLVFLRTWTSLIYGIQPHSPSPLSLRVGLEESS